MNTVKTAFLCAMLICLTVTIDPAHAAEPSVGAVTRIQNTARINGAPVSRKDQIFAGDTVTTDDTGRLEVTFRDGTILTVGGSAEFTIDEYSYTPDSSGKAALFRLSRGAFRTVTSTLVNSAPENFRVATPLATIGIRGTDFWGGFLSNDTLDVIMLKGKGVVVTTSGGTVIIEKPGFGVTVPDPSLPPQNLKQWGQAKVSRAIATIDFQ